MYLKKIASELLRINAYYALTYDKSYNTYTRGTSKCAVMDLTYLFAERFDVSKTVRREVYNWLVGRNKATAEELAVKLLNRYYSDYTPLVGYDG